MIESIKHNDIEHKIDLYVNGQLSEEETEELWVELIQDQYYLDYLKSVANTKAVIEARKKKKKAARKRRYWSYSAAAVIVLLVTVLSVFNFQGSTDAPEVQPVSSIELDYYRSSDGSVAAADDEQIIREAIALANTGKFDEAIGILKAELDEATDPKWVAELNLNLGSLHYNEGNYQSSIDHFQSVIDNKDSIDILVLEKAYWYIGNAHFQLDELEIAREYISNAYELNGAYRRVAKSYLDALDSVKAP